MTTQSLITRTPLVLALVAFACASAGDSREPIEVNIHQPDRVDPGFLFWHQSDELQQDVENISVLVDSAGKLVHTWPTNLTGGGTPAYLLDGGRVLRTGILDRRNVAGGPIASTDAIQVVDAHGNVIWQFLATQLENYAVPPRHGADAERSFSGNDVQASVSRRSKGDRLGRRRGGTKYGPME